MNDALVKGLSANFDYALRLLEDAITDCPESLWETDLWPDEEAQGPSPRGGVGGSAPWNLAHHALTILDYDLTGDFERWEAPPPFDQNKWGNPTRVFSRTEMLGYVEWCRKRVAQVVASLTDESAARPLPKSHRYTGTPYGVIASSLPLHTVEHASQIRQFLTAGGIKQQVRAGDMVQLDVLVRAVTGATDDEIRVWCGNFGGVAEVVAMVFAGMRAIQRPTGDCQVGWNLGDGIQYVFSSRAGENDCAKRKANDARCVVTMSAPDFLRYTCRLLPMAEAVPSGRITIAGDVSELQRMYGR